MKKTNSRISDIFIGSHNVYMEKLADYCKRARDSSNEISRILKGESENDFDMVGHVLDTVKHLHDIDNYMDSLEDVYKSLPDIIKEK